MHKSALEGAPWPVDFVPRRAYNGRHKKPCRHNGTCTR